MKITEIKRQMKELENENEDIFNKAERKSRDFLWSYLESTKFEENKNKIKELRLKSQEYYKEKNKDKKYFVPHGDWGSNATFEIIDESENLFLCFKKGNTAYGDRMSGSGYLKPMFIIFKKGKKNIYRADDYHDKIWEIEINRKEKKEALEKAKEELRKLSSQ